MPDDRREQVERLLRGTALEMLTSKTGFDLSGCQLPSVEGERLILKCPRAIALRLKSKLVKEKEFAEEFLNSANRLYGSSAIFLHTEENKAVCQMSQEGLRMANSIRKNQEKMITQVQDSILPQYSDQAALFTSILWSPELLTLVSEETQLPVVVSAGYTKWTGQPLLKWIGDRGNETRWGNGELIKMQERLTQEPDQILREYDYPAGFAGDGDRPYLFTTSFQRVQIAGKWYRFARVHGASPLSTMQ